MKRIAMILVWALALLLSCGNKGEQPGGDKTPLAVSPLSLNFVSLGEQKTLSVTSSADWLVRSSASWLKALTPKGTSADKQIRVSADENKEKSERSAKLTVSNLDGESVEITVTQDAAGDETGVRGISSAADLVGLSKAVRGEGSIAQYLVDGVIKFNKDIDASSITDWIPIGDTDHPLTYSIDGNNRSITGVNWKVDATKDMNVGLVGVGKDITISKLTFGGTGSQVEFKVTGAGKVRAAAIIGRALGVTVQKVTNNAALTVSGTAATGNDLIIGGIAGYADSNSLIGGETESSMGCKSLGNITVPVAAQAGGIVGYSSGAIQNCTFRATISGPVSGSYGPAWLCSYGNPSAKTDVVSNYGYGYVNETPACMRNAMMNVEDGYDPEQNTVDWTLDAYYDWTEVETKTLHSGVVYHHYSCKNVPREIFALEVNLQNPGIEITAAYAGEMIPNPNGNDNNNNGKNIRELLSELCARRRSEGQKILAGVNAGFFDSNDGICRGFHVEDRQPGYINNPKVVSNLGNHKWGFTVFTDGTASCGIKKFTGKMRHAGEEYNYYSLNDTILRHVSADYEANLYNSRYVRQPYSAYPKLQNKLASDALYVVCEYTGTPMEVNAGYAQARVVDIRDGRTGSITLPYITAKNQVGVALSGVMANTWKSKVKVGDTVEFRCDITVDGVSKPILTQVSTMYQLMTDGQDASNTPGSSASLYTKYDPKTFPVVSQDLKKVWLVEIDGRQLWYSLGVKGYEMYRIAKKLGGWWTTGLDGGGSSAMWLWDASKGKGGLVSKPCDSKGERSCMNYLLIREK